MTDQTYDYTQYKAGPGDNLLAQISATALEQKEAEAEVARCEEALQKAQAKLKDIAEHRLPKLMDEAEQKKLTTKDGIIVDVTETIRGSIPEANFPKAKKWLEEQGDDKLIKRKFEIEFGKADVAWATKFENDLKKRKKPLKYKVKESVHPSTLASYVTEKLQKGVAIPLDTFGVFRQRKTKISFEET